MKKLFKYSILVIVGCAAILTVLFINAVEIEEPSVEDVSALSWEVDESVMGLKTTNGSWFRKSKSGLFELFVSGSAFERGVANGKLAEELIVKQEEIFVDQIHRMVPSNTYLKFLKYLVGWFNRELPNHVSQEQLQEIYGVSRTFSDDFDFIAPKYMRSLNYHAAHDIGHALQDRNFTVGCTSFGAWNNRTKDGSMIIGRNFDFYVGDKFAEDKIVNFVNPNEGYKLMFVTWGGFTGAVSGMNETGLTVTINASKSDYPTGAATPISLLAKEILQYSSTIDEAYQIAKRKQTFVSESIMVGSVKDSKTAIIEKSPTKHGIHFVEEDYVICSNNFQSDAFKNDSMNIQNIRTSSSQYRYDRMDELIHENEQLDYLGVAAILRDRHGLNDEVIGNGNEKALNQLIAHHAVIFKPEQRLAWVSAGPYQIGKFICYDLNKVFNEYHDLDRDIEISIDSLEIPADEFILTEEYANYERFKSLRKQILSDGYKLTDQVQAEFIETNPHYYLTYYSLGDYFFANGDFNSAKTSYNQSLTKVLPVTQEREYLMSRIEKCQEKLSNR
ncbi:C45 family peptidase [Flavobacteriales bacterium]|nr:C45 family peptidase [Flavobacteriales bacterium]